MAGSSLGEYGCELAIAIWRTGGGDPDAGEKVRADLIVMGPRKRSFWLTHVKRGVTLDVLARAKCPVLTVH